MTNTNTRTFSNAQSDRSCGDTESNKKTIKNSDDSIKKYFLCDMFRLQLFGVPFLSTLVLNLVNTSI
jgi:hypothetical protein